MKIPVYYNVCETNLLCDTCAFQENTNKMREWHALLEQHLGICIDILETQARNECLSFDPNFLWSAAQLLKLHKVPWD